MSSFFIKVKQHLAAYYGHNHLKWYANYLYREKFGRNINWKKPTEFNEKIRWMMFCTDTSLWTLCADKYRVRDYVAQRGHSEILTELYGMWESVDDIDFDQLPQSFVIKPNNGTADVSVVPDKSIADYDKIIETLRRSINSPLGYRTAEIHYLGIMPCVIAEEMLPNDTSFSSSIVDYKFYCFNGEPFCCGVFYNRDRECHQRSATFYDMNWEKRPDWLEAKRRSRSGDVPKPKNFELMKQLCHDLTSGVPFVRLDLYEAKGKVYFGEYTFSPASASGGSLNPDLFGKLGDMIDLSLCKKKEKK